MEKSALRKALLAQRRALLPEQVSAQSDAIASRVMALPEFHEATALYAYVAAKGEVETRGLIAEALARGVPVYCPRVEGEGLAWGRVLALEALVPGAFGVLEPPKDAPMPPPPDAHAVCLVPAVAVRRDGHRLGQGGGYYDRFLQGFPGTAVALAYAWQWSNTFAPEAHDVAVQVIVSESETHYTNKSAPR